MLTRNSYKITFILLCISIYIAQTPFKTLAQDKGFSTDYVMGGGEEELMMEAMWFLNSKDFDKALTMFVDLDSRYPGVAAYKYYAGMCYLYKEDEQEKAIEYMEAAYKLPHKTNELPDLAFFLGKTYLTNKNYDKATEFFTIAMDPAQGTEKSLLGEIEMLRLHAQNGKAGAAKGGKKYTITNLGAPTNTRWGQSMPVQSINGSMMVYAYKGNRSLGGPRNPAGDPDPDGDYMADMWLSYNTDGVWSTGKDMGPGINTNKNDFPLALSADGSKLLIYRQVGKDEKSGEIYQTVLMGKKWSLPTPIPGQVNSKYWEGAASLSIDGKTLYFASNRPGGSGGKDLYSATLNDDNTWGNVKNLGNVINSKYDETSPFIHAAGNVLYYSSKGHSSIGGFDILYSRKNGKDWSKPSNIAGGINTPNDDLYFNVTADGKEAYYSAILKGGKGKTDIYKVTPGLVGKTPTLAVISGKCTKLGKNVESTIIVTNTTTNKSYTTAKSNATNGSYGIGLEPGSKYKLEFQIIRNNQARTYHTEILDLTKLDRYVNISTDFEFDKGRNPSIKKTDLIQKNLEIELNGGKKEVIAAKPKEETKEDVKEETKEEVVEEETNEDAKEETKEEVASNSSSSENSTSSSSKTNSNNKTTTETHIVSSNKSHGTFNSIEFPDNSDTQIIPKEFRTELNLVSIALMANEKVRLQVNGYSDNTGTEEFNKAISLKRAEMVAKYLISKHISKEKLIIEGHGSANPVASNDTPDGQKQNRRVEMQLMLELTDPGN